MAKPKEADSAGTFFGKLRGLRQDLPSHSGTGSFKEMSRISEAIEKLEKILDRHICFSRREELQDVLNLLKEEQESIYGSKFPKDNDNNDNDMEK